MPEAGRGTALDAGCGEGQDLRFLAERGYRATGVDFTTTGVAKARRLLQARGLPAELFRLDLRDLGSERDPLGGRQFDLVLAVNALQFMGAEAGTALDRLRDLVRPGGVIGSASSPARGTSRRCGRDSVHPSPRPPRPLPGLAAPGSRQSLATGTPATPTASRS